MTAIDGAPVPGPDEQHASDGRDGTGDRPGSGGLGGRDRPRRVLGMTRRGRWVAAGVLAVVAASAAFDVGHSAGSSARAGDLRGLVSTINSDVAACNSSLRDSYSAYAAVAGGQTGLRRTAESIVAGDEPNCTPAGNSDLFDLATTEAPATLRAYGVQAAVAQVDRWAFPDAASAINDLDTLLSQPTAAAAAAARRDLSTRVDDMVTLAASAQQILAAAGSHVGTAVGSLDVGAASGLRAGGL